MFLRAVISLGALLLCAGWAGAEYGDKDPYELSSAIKVLEANGGKVHRNGLVQIDIVVPGLGQADHVTKERLPETYTLNVMGMKSSPENLEAMIVLPEVDSLYLGAEFKRTEAAWDTLNKFGELKNLYIIDDLTDADFPRLAQFQGLNLLAIRLGKFSPESLWYLESMHELESLSLTIERPLKESYMPSLPQIPNLRHLELAILSDQHVPLTGIENLASSLTSLEVNAKSQPVGRLCAIGQLSRLERLNLSGVDFTADGLCMFAKLDQLQHLTMFQCVLPSTGEDNLAQLHNLQRIDLNDVPLTDAMLIQLAKLPHLTHLYVRNAKLTDACLAEIARSDSLKMIRFSGTEVTVQGAKWLQEECPDMNFILADGL
ncbi:hypothetical protein DTL42_22105 [Bremerella cremea]|uniref:Leucine Rich repeats (2 copies) n=1 Tax=Bremerella cremea TaxID=1031537 RepID=A0A368KMS8_9BACT|nr:hypothetical protein [Bremerella cremea]RCS41263.1 hypothetical protein DTL42_22105 [Bremerella cremea]